MNSQFLEKNINYLNLLFGRTIILTQSATDSFATQFLEEH